MPDKETPNKEETKKRCEGCKRSLEHLSTVLPFNTLEKVADKPLKIRGVAMTTCMSRNLNIYTAEELAAFADKLTDSPVYIEHVSVPNAIGRVIKTEWDGTTLWYEAEIYDDEIAGKIRKGLIQHVSVGADYETIDLVDGKVPHGLHNAELSLVAVPGIPQTNLQVIEKLEKMLQEKIVQSEADLSNAQKTIEQLQKQIPSNELLKNPPQQMTISEHISILEGLLPPKVVEYSSMGMQRFCQEIKAAIFKAKQRLAGGN